MFFLHVARPKTKLHVLGDEESTIDASIIENPIAHFSSLVRNGLVMKRSLEPSVERLRCPCVCYDVRSNTFFVTERSGHGPPIIHSQLWGAKV